MRTTWAQLPQALLQEIIELGCPLTCFAKVRRVCSSWATAKWTGKYYEKPQLVTHTCIDRQIKTAKTFRVEMRSAIHNKDLVGLARAWFHLGNGSLAHALLDVRIWQLLRAQRTELLSEALHMHMRCHEYTACHFTREACWVKSQYALRQFVFVFWPEIDLHGSRANWTLVDLHAMTLLFLSTTDSMARWRHELVSQHPQTNKTERCLCFLLAASRLPLDKKFEDKKFDSLMTAWTLSTELKDLGLFARVTSDVARYALNKFGKATALKCSEQSLRAYSDLYPENTDHVLLTAEREFIKSLE
jgi:hypothetical protein